MTKQLKLFQVEREEKRLYELPEGWRWVRLGEVCEVNKNSRNPSKEMPDEEFLYIDITGVESGTGEIKETKRILGRDAPSRARRAIHQGDVIMSTVRPYLKAFTVVPPEYDNQICSTGFAVLTCNNEILPKFLLYALISDVAIEQCNKMMIGAHYPALNNEQVSEIKIPLPPLSEQKRIIARIEELFSKIEEIKRLRKEALEDAKALMPSALHEVFSKADEKGWRWVRLGEVGKYINGRAFKPEEWEEKGLPIIRIQNLTNPDFPFNYYPNPLEPKYYVKNGDLLISWSATLDAFIWNRGDAVLNQHIFRVEENKKLIQKEFLFYVVKYLLHQLKEKTHGSTMKHITKKKFENLTIPLLPLLEEQKRIVAYLDKIQEKAIALQKLQEEMEKEIERLKESILHKAFGGEL